MFVNFDSSHIYHVVSHNLDFDVIIFYHVMTFYSYAEMSYYKKSIHVNTSINPCEQDERGAVNLKWAIKQSFNHIQTIESYLFLNQIQQIDLFKLM